jgi:hypothetical protein
VEAFSHIALVTHAFDHRSITWRSPGPVPAESDRSASGDHFSITENG